MSLGMTLGLALVLTVLLAAGAASGPVQPTPEQAADTSAAQAAAVSQTRRWMSETVDASNYYIGIYNSLALEPSAPFTPHISYLDWTNSNLKHAWWTPSGWLSETVDSSGAVGWDTSLALEPTAPFTAHISYHDGGNQSLKHAWWTPSGWLSETVDSSGDVGQYTSLALEPALPYTPHISYFDADGALKHAWWTPSGWLSETVDSREFVGSYTSLALEPTAPFTPHISYHGILPDSALLHAWWTPSGWLSETIDTGFDLGRHTSLALASTPPYTPSISYYDNDNQNLKYAWWTPSGWLSETVDSSGTVADATTALALEPTAPFVPHIGYIAGASLKHAWWTPSGWYSETVGSGIKYPSLALEPTTPFLPHISYFANSGGMLRYARPVIPQMLFDEAHDEINTLSWARAQQVEPGHPEWVYFGQLSSTLASGFTLVRNPDALLTPQLLQGYDALILSAPQAEFTSGEIAAIQLFVDSGGGLIVLGSCGLEHPANTFLSDYDIALDEHCIFSPIPQLEGDFPVTDFASHPAVAGVSSFVTNFGQTLELGSGAADLAWTENDVWQDVNWNDTYDAGTDETGPFAIAAGYDTGCGRVAVVSDNSFQDDGFEWRGNAPLMRALLHWVTGGPECDLSFVYLPLALREYD
jgi:hypothetical protein